MNNDHNKTQDTVNEESHIDTGGVSVDDRRFVEDALIAAGANITDSGFGCGGADLGYVWNGRTFNLNLSERIAQTQKAA